MTSKKSNDERIENIQSHVEEKYDDIQRLRWGNRWQSSENNKIKNLNE